MAARIDVLTTGYANLVKLDTLPKQHAEASSLTESGRQAKYMRATGSCCLVRSSGRSNILFDTMGPWEKNLLEERLAKLKIHPDDIELLVCSHSHPDHIGNLNLFTKATKHFVGTSVYSNDIYDLNCFEPIGSYTYKSDRSRGDDSEIETVVIRYRSYDVDANVIIEPTPGHTMECISMYVSNCESYGTVALAGDLFENESDVRDESVWLGAGSQNPDIQRANRSRVYNKVAYILPGHGPLFKTQRPSQI